MRKRPLRRPTPTLTTTTGANNRSSRPHLTGPTSSATTVTEGDIRGRVAPQLAEPHPHASQEDRRGTQRWLELTRMVNRPRRGRWRR